MPKAQHRTATMGFGFFFFFPVLCWGNTRFRLGPVCLLGLREGNSTAWKVTRSSGACLGASAGWHARLGISHNLYRFSGPSSSRSAVCHPYRALQATSGGRPPLTLQEKRSQGAEASAAAARRGANLAQALDAGNDGSNNEAQSFLDGSDGDGVSSSSSFLHAPNLFTNLGYDVDSTQSVE